MKSCNIERNRLFILFPLVIQLFNIYSKRALLFGVFLGMNITYIFAESFKYLAEITYNIIINQFRQGA